MLSEGRPGIDNLFSLQDGKGTMSIFPAFDYKLSFAGVLRLELDKESYQRCGLQGQPVPGGGRKHMKTRYRMFSWRYCLRL
jgi:ribonucleases P/MRP protein subunit RPP40